MMLRRYSCRGRINQLMRRKSLARNTHVLSSGSREPRRVGYGVVAGLGDDEPGDVPLWKSHEHTAAVKILASDPHVSGVLVMGGGTQAKHI